VDFGPALQIVQAEREAKARLTPEERKIQAAARKAQREALRAQYGYAQVNGEQVELGNYLVEPSGIFMDAASTRCVGGGKRARASQTLRSTSVPMHLVLPATGSDRLAAGIAVGGPLARQAVGQDQVCLAERHGLNQAGARSGQVRQGGPAACRDGDRPRPDPVGSVEPRRQATDGGHSMLPDRRAGSARGRRKDEDEADTVGATTLRPEHIKLHDNGVAEFRFLGKDSVLWHKKLALPEAVQASLMELKDAARRLVPEKRQQEPYRNR